MTAGTVARAVSAAKVGDELAAGWGDEMRAGLGTAGPVDTPAATGWAPQAVSVARMTMSDSSAARFGFLRSSALLWASRSGRWDSVMGLHR